VEEGYFSFCNKESQDQQFIKTAIDKFNSELVGSSLADKVAGKSDSSVVFTFENRSNNRQGSKLKSFGSFGIT
jgi:hypothetical protein